MQKIFNDKTNLIGPWFSTVELMNVDNIKQQRIP